MPMEITEHEKRLFHARRAAERLADALELDLGDSVSFVRGVENNSVDALRRVLADFNSLSESAAYGTRCYFEFTLTFPDLYDPRRFSEAELIAPMSLASFAEGFIEDEGMLLASSFIVSSIDRISLLMGKMDCPDISERATANQNRLRIGAFVQSCILEETLDDPSGDDASQMDFLEWLADHADEIRPFVRTVRSRSIGVIDAQLCRDLIMSARGGASPVLSEGLL